MEQAAKIPFDDRRSLEGRVSDISRPLLLDFLAEVRSQLASQELPTEVFLDKLRLTVRVNDHMVPKNVAVLFFSEEPERFFRGAFIEVVQFGGDTSGDLLEERSFKGPLPLQVKSSLNHVRGITGSISRKVPDKAEAEVIYAYPFEALEEAIVNAVYHRSYESPPEPVKVYIYSNRIEIYSYPGPVPGIALDHLQSGSIPAVPARNRRIGDFLKDLRLAEARGTGIPKIRNRMRENGSPDPEFYFDADRTFFRVTLPINPGYASLLKKMPSLRGTVRI
jgi:ATP-dependent DNA helicase RecG